MFSRVVVVSFISLFLAGCLSGGGGGSPSASAPPPPSTPPQSQAFTSWSAISKPGTATVTGNTLEGSYTSNPSNNFLVTSVSNPTTGTGTVQLTYDSSALTAASITGKNSSVSFNASNGDTINAYALFGAPTIDVALSKNGQQQAIAADPYANGYNYQSYGIWETGLGTGSGNVAAISVGSQTPPASIPTSGSATFNGAAVGAYVDTTGQNYLTTGLLSLATNFGTRSIALKIDNTQLVSPNTNGVTLTGNTVSGGLNMNGNLSYAAGVNGFTGNISTGNGMTGSANGVFYGPAATEAGGTFSAKGSGVQSYIGAFGAKR